MKMWMKGVVVTGLLAVVCGAPLEAQRVVKRPARVGAFVNVRVVRPAPRPIRRFAVRAPVSAAALRCDRREDVWDRREDRRDRAEDVADAREDIWDARHDGGLRDRLEDVADAREDARDRAEDVRDRREDRWDRTHLGTRPAVCRSYW